MHRFLLLTVIVFLNISVFAQDTITVQTLTFDSITTRRGVWNFPEGETYRKILMEYTLKCDAATTQDQFECGEWDYLTYSTIFKHTGRFDSNAYYQPRFNFYNGQAPDSVAVRNSAGSSKIRYKNIQTTPVDTLSYSFGTIGTDDVLNENIFDGATSSGRAQFIYTSEELTSIGISAGPISSLKLYFEGDAGFKNFKIKYSLLEDTAFETTVPDQDLTDIYTNSVDIDESGWMTFSLHTPIEYDGNSNILIDFSYDRTETGGTNAVLCSEDIDKGIFTNGNESAIDLDGANDHLRLSRDVFNENGFTIEAWVKVRSHNNWSRLFDFGNGPGADNVLFALSKGTSGKPYFSIRKGENSYSAQAPNAIPLNEWVHLAFTVNESNFSLMYINGQFVAGGYFPFPENVEREFAYIGRSNWSNDKFANVIIDEFRVYNYAKEMSDYPATIYNSISNPENTEGLILYYDFQTMQNNITTDQSNEENHAYNRGYPKNVKVHGEELVRDFTHLSDRPVVIFESVTTTEFSQEETFIYEELINAADQIVYCWDELNPTTPTDTIEAYISGKCFVYENNIIIDTLTSVIDNYLVNEDILYYGEPFEITDNYEIARFITPYGINLDLGNEGFKWVYDVTDYAHLLQGEVDFRAGNQQELIDVKFKLIQGTPPRDIIKFDTIWGHRKSYRYNYLGGDSAISTREISLEDEAELFKVITRITGHGHNSNDGSYPHCCEWKDNTHYLFVNGNEAANWHIWQTNECAENPVYPQGGTWNGSREGWCPGDVVKDFEFEISDMVVGNSVSLDYGITDVPEDNLGMGWGNYVITMYLAQYGGSNFQNDVEVYDVINPNNWEYYSRKNPICKDPEIIIRNNGADTLRTLKIEYNVSGGNSRIYNWEGSLAPHHKENIHLPATSDHFWLGDGSNKFIVKVSYPNGVLDEYQDNDVYETHYTMPDILEQQLIFEYKTNNQPERYHLIIKDLNDNVVLEKSDLEPSTLYRDTLTLNLDCYHLELTDTENMGLSYWAYPGQGSGYFRIRNIDNDIIKYFGSDFGHSINYAFRVGETMFVQEPVPENFIEVFPNPSSDYVTIRSSHLDGRYQVKIITLDGKTVFEQDFEGDIMNQKIVVSDFAKGMYLITINHSEGFRNQKLVIE